MSITPSEIKFTLNDDRSVVTLTINGTDAKFSAQDFENLLGWLGGIRAQMQPAVPTAISANTQMLPLAQLVIAHPAGAVGTPTETGAVFAARSEMFGWLQFIAEPKFCEGIRNWLGSAPPAGSDVLPTPVPKQ